VVGKTVFDFHPPDLAAQYDAVQIINNTVKQCGGDDSTCIKNYLYNMSEYNGTMGKYKFDSNGDLLISDFFAHKKLQMEPGLK
jgi:ABC-type branched-subunit amino acid transport system substrate-binding protein